MVTGTLMPSATHWAPEKKGLKGAAKRALVGASPLTSLLPAHPL